jgi:hypothetical protein
MDLKGPVKEDRRPPLPLDELRRELTDLESGSFTSLSDSELQEKVRIIHQDFTFRAPIFPIGTLIYRAVRVSQRPTHKSRISYPPIDVVKSNGRLNRVGEVIFYGALNQFASCLQECSWQVGEFFAVSAWLTTQAMTFNHLGYSTAVLGALNSEREVPFFAQMNQDSERNALIREWQARIFTQRVLAGQENLYRLPIALKTFALSKMVQIDPHSPDIFSGVIYPSTAMWLLGDNIAILPAEVETKMALFEVILLTLDSIKETRKSGGSITTNFAMKPYDFARADPDGNLIWGQKSQVIYPTGTDASRFSPRLLAPEIPP